MNDKTLSRPCQAESLVRNSGAEAVITGAGPAGLFCAWLLTAAGIETELYDQKPVPGLKYILAGMSGLNVTCDRDINDFAEKYGDSKGLFIKLLEGFSPADMTAWYGSLGFRTFTGTGGKVFLENADASDVVARLMGELEGTGRFRFFPSHKLSGIGDDRSLVFSLADGSEKRVKPDFAVFSLGGASRPETGSDGMWARVFREHGIKVNRFRPANCGFETGWSSHFREKASGKPVKNIKITHNGKTSRGELVVTEYGIEGNGIYPLSAGIRDEIEARGKSVIVIDLLPDLTAEYIAEKIGGQKKSSSLSNMLRKAVKITGTRYLLLRELTDNPGNFTEDQAGLESVPAGSGLGLQPEVAKAAARRVNKIAPGKKGSGTNLSELICGKPAILKQLEMTLLRPRPVEEAISSAGGLSLESVDSNLMLAGFPGYYAVGEMLDWEAPTGGYLLQGCFSTAYKAAMDIISKKGKV